MRRSTLSHSKDACLGLAEGESTVCSRVCPADGLPLWYDLLISSPSLSKNIPSLPPSLSPLLFLPFVSFITIKTYPPLPSSLPYLFLPSLSFIPILRVGVSNERLGEGERELSALEKQLLWSFWEPAMNIPWLSWEYKCLSHLNEFWENIQNVPLCNDQRVY